MTSRSWDDKLVCNMIWNSFLEMKSISKSYLIKIFSYSIRTAIFWLFYSHPKVSPCSGRSYSTQRWSLFKAWLHAFSSAGKADCRCHCPTTQLLHPHFLSHDSHFRKEVCSMVLWIPASSKLKKRNIWFNLEGRSLYKFCLTTKRIQDQQFLKTKLCLHMAALFFLNSPL